MAKTIFITGATGGLGGAVAQKFAAEGYKVAVGYHSNMQKAEKIVKNLSGSGHIAVQCSVHKSVTIVSAIDTIKQAFGSLDVLVNNGGSTKFIPHENMDCLTDEVIDDMFAIHVRGVLACVRTALPIINTNGVIVNISSIAAKSGMGSNIAYCGAKAAINTIIKSLARSLAPKIRVIGVAPGLLHTDFVKGAGSDTFFENQIKSTPLQRLGTTDEVAGAIYAGVEYMPFTTGCVLSVDGGRLLS